MWRSISLKIFILSSVFTSLLSAQLNWQPVPGPYGGDIRDLKQDLNGNYYAASVAGLFVSYNNCQTWQKVNIPGFKNDGMKEIFIHPSGNIFISSFNSFLYRSDENKSEWAVYPNKKQLQINSQGVLYGANQRVLFSSTNSGISWKTLKDFKKYINSFCLINDSCMVVASDSVYYSSDAGRTWKNSTVPFNMEQNFAKDKNDNVYFIYENNLLKSADYGRTWSIIKKYGQPFEPDFLSSIISRVVVDKNDHIYISSFTDLIVSKDKGLSWQKCAPKEFDGLNLCLDNSSNLFCLGGPHGIYKYDPVNNSLNKSSSGLTGHYISRYWNWKGKIICETAISGCWITPDEGNTWEEIKLRKFHKILFINSNDRIYTLGSYSLVYSDDGINWTEINFADYLSLRDASLIDYNNTILLFDDDNNLHRTTDNGNHWDLVWSTEDFHEPKLIHTGISDQFYFSIGKDLYKSNDNGKTWNHAASFNDNISTISVSPWGNIYLFAGNEFLENNYNGWQKLSTNIYKNGLPLPNQTFKWVTKIEYTKSNHMILIGNDILVSNDYGKTFSYFDENIGKDLLNCYPAMITAPTGNILYSIISSGILKSSYQTAQLRIPNQIEVLNNYPNPFNNQTVIEFFVNESGNYDLSIYDILGRRIENIINDRLEKGFYKITWNANNFASGVYFYKIEALPSDESKPFTQVKKMILVK